MSINDIINIYVQDKNLTASMKSFLRGRYQCHSIEDENNYPNMLNTDMTNMTNIFIMKNFPEKIHKGAKYILLTDSPNEIELNQLDILYDIWPKTLSLSLIKFFTVRLLRQIQSELKNTSDARKYQARLVEMAHQDYLTGLATRWYLQEYVQNIQHEKNITCIYLDLDNFKYVNDTYGHQAGDRALAATAEMIQREFSDGFAARMGGDEFMVVLPGMRTLHDVEAKVNIFIKNLLDYYQSTPTMKKLSVSAGIAQKLEGSEKSIDTLIHESDTALYAAKKSGKNCCKIYFNDE